MPSAIKKMRQVLCMDDARTERSKRGKEGVQEERNEREARAVLNGRLSLLREKRRQCVSVHRWQGERVYLVNRTFA